MSFPGEKIYNSTREIKYVLQKPDQPSNALVVVFSAFPRKGTPPAYNYVKTIQGVNTNKLFILDDHGPDGCYYLGGNRDFSVEESVISLINEVCSDLNIPLKNVISFGSSKGGYASLYFGLKYGFGYIISAAPQTKLGNYVFNHAKDMAAYIAGGLEEADKDFLNSLLYTIAESSYEPTIYLHIGKGDHHYKGHVIPFIEKLDSVGKGYELDVADYEKHGEVGVFFPPYLNEKLAFILNKI